MNANLVLIVGGRDESVAEQNEQCAAELERLAAEIRAGRVGDVLCVCEIGTSYDFTARGSTRDVLIMADVAHAWALDKFRS